MDRRHFMAGLASTAVLPSLALSRLGDLSNTYIKQLPPEQRAAQAAIEFSQLEEQGLGWNLYSFLHLDAKALIPMDAVVGWYESEFFPNGPGTITVTGVNFVSWTWGVTGITYPNTAEVSFIQPFANGSIVEDVVRLVEDNGVWHWFFGRSREFVNQQISAHAPAYSLIDVAEAASSQVVNAVAPWGLDQWPASSIDIDTFRDSLPSSVNRHMLGRIESVSSRQFGVPIFAREDTTAKYYVSPETVIPSGEVHAYSLLPDISVMTALESAKGSWRSTLGFTMLRQNLDASSRVAFMFLKGVANEAVGSVPVLYWGDRERFSCLFAASMVDYVSLRVLVTEIADSQ